jgi:hypothetical protein
VENLYFNAGYGGHEYTDNVNTYIPGTEYRFKVQAKFSDLSLEGPYSNWKPVTISGTAVNYWELGGWIYGHTDGETRLRVYQADTGMPPLDPPVYMPDTVFFMTGFASPDDQFYFGLMPEGDYWVYAYNNLNAVDDWATAFKRTIRTIVLDTNRLGIVLQLHFNPGISAASSILTGTMAGGTSPENIVELYWWNETDYDYYFLGLYYTFQSGTINITNFPSLSEMAAFFSMTYDSYSDYYYMICWNDENYSGGYDYGDTYYYDESLDLPLYYIGDMTADLDAGTLWLDSTNTYLGKRPALGKSLAAAARK